MIKKRNRPEKLVYFQKGLDGRPYLNKFTEAFIYVMVKSQKGVRIKMRVDFVNNPIKIITMGDRMRTFKTMMLAKVLLPEPEEPSQEIVHKNLESQKEFKESRTTYIKSLATRIQTR